MLNKTGLEEDDVIVIEAHMAFFLTHGFGAYETDDGKIHFDGLFYADSKVYTNYTFVQEAIYSPEYPTGFVIRFILDLNEETALGKQDGTLVISLPARQGLMVRSVSGNRPHCYRLAVTLYNLFQLG